MAGRLEGKVAVITGGVSGIGLGTVELFVAEGAKVVAADIQDEKGAMLEQRFPGRVRYAHCDVTKEAEIAAAVKLAADEFGGLDILFNNAGISDGMRELASIEAETWSWIYDVLVRGPALGMKHATPLMLARGGGAIVNTASIAALQSGAAPTAYSVAKAGVLHLSRMAAADLARHRIRVNAVCPGFITTNIFTSTVGIAGEKREQANQIIAQMASNAQPVARAGRPEDIAAAVAYLLSDDAGFVTGTHILVDGGLAVGMRHSWDPDTPGLFDSLVAFAA